MLQMIHRVFPRAGATICILFVALMVVAPASIGQTRKKSGKSGQQKTTVNSVWIDHRTNPVNVNADVTVADANIQIEFLTEDQGQEASKVWLRHYQGVPNPADIPKPERPPGGDAGATTSFVVDSTTGKRKWGPFSACADLTPPAGTETNNNTIVIWAYYQYADHVRYYRIIIPYEAQLPEGIVKALLNGMSAQEGSAFLLAKKNRLHTFTSKVDGRHASRVYMKIVPNKNIPVAKMPRNPPLKDKHLKVAEGIVLDRGITRRWSFLNFDMPKVNQGDAKEYTIMIWAAYFHPANTQYFRYSCCVKGSNKSK